MYTTKKNRIFHSTKLLSKSVFGVLVLFSTLILANASEFKPIISDESEFQALNFGKRIDPCAFKQDMRKLWTDHVVWTRLYIIAAIADQPDAEAAATRLLKNQDDIGNAVIPFFGNDAGTDLTALLKEHISIAVEIIAAAKAGDDAAKNAALERWDANAVKIANFLADANSSWDRQKLIDMMKMHLSTTVDEVVARLNKDWNADVIAFDAVFDHILHFSDVLSVGLIKHFPRKFKRYCRL